MNAPARGDRVAAGRLVIVEREIAGIPRLGQDVEERDDPLAGR